MISTNTNSTGTAITIITIYFSTINIIILKMCVENRQMGLCEMRGVEN